MVSTNARKPKSLSGSEKSGRSFARFPSWVFGAPRVSPNAKLVFLALIDHTDKEKAVVWPSVKRIAEMTGLGTTSVRQSLRQLEDLGMITTEAQPWHATNRYTIVGLSDADIARIQGATENALTSDDAKLRGSDLGATRPVAPPTPPVGPPTPSVGGATPAANEEEPGKKNQGTRTNKQTQRDRAGGAARPNQEIEMTMEDPRTEHQHPGGLHARLQRIAAGNEISGTATDALVEKLRGAKNTDQDLQFTSLDALMTEDQSPAPALKRLEGHKFRTLWNTDEAQQDLAKKLAKRQKALGASESAEPTQAPHQNEEIVAQELVQPWERPLNVDDDGLDHELLDSFIDGSAWKSWEDSGAIQGHHERLVAR